MVRVRVRGEIVWKRLERSRWAEVVIEVRHNFVQVPRTLRGGVLDSGPRAGNNHLV